MAPEFSSAWLSQWKFSDFSECMGLLSFLSFSLFFWYPWQTSSSAPNYGQVENWYVKKSKNPTWQRVTFLGSLLTVRISEKLWFLHVGFPNATRCVFSWKFCFPLIPTVFCLPSLRADDLSPHLQWSPCLMFLAWPRPSGDLLVHHFDSIKSLPSCRQWPHPPFRLHFKLLITGQHLQSWSTCDLCLTVKHSTLPAGLSSAFLYL